MSYDLTTTVAAHLDRHLVLSMFDFLLENKVYSVKDLLQAKLQLVRSTKMVDFAEELQKSLNGDAPAEPNEQRDAVYKQLEDSKKACEQLMELLFNADLVDELRASNNFTLEYLKEHHNITEDLVEHLHQYAKINFECGRYRDAGDLLFYYRLLSRDSNKVFSSLWGKLAAEILVNSWDVALQDWEELKKDIDSRAFSNHAEQLQQRTWLIHWSLFIFFRLDDGPSRMIDALFKEDKLLNTIQTNCPHILRYLTVAVMVDKRRKSLVNDFVRILKMERSTYCDPIIDFLLNVYVDFDFESARQSLQAAAGLMKRDFFLSGKIHQEFMEQARVLMFETICRIHKHVDIAQLTKLLDLEADEKTERSASESDRKSGGAERKIVDLIRLTRIDAKIDSDNHRLVVTTHYPSIYQQVIDRTKSLALRTNALATQVEKKYALLDVSEE